MSTSVRIFTDAELNQLIAEARATASAVNRILTFPDFRRWTNKLEHVLTPDDEKLLRTWGHEGFQDINDFLRKVGTEKNLLSRSEISHAKSPAAHVRMMQGAAHVLDKLFAKTIPAPKTFVAYRGMSKKHLPIKLADRPRDVDKIKSRLVGKTIQLPGYTAMSLDFGVAIRFSSEYSLRDMMILVAEIPQGAKVVPVPPEYSAEVDEMEVLLPHNAKFQITDLTFGDYSESYDERDLQTLYVTLGR